ncbi:polysaccharide deacetylase family protein [Phytohabitans kaempferiae]|uniref:Polysaccharide deacetylase family protein n=1 Tax=Phytohabitans kaempferiae TaxID=1620943 RepID=A0ABV6LUU2_9ACTN
MTHRAAVISALVVLALLVGGRWVLAREPIEAIATEQGLGPPPEATVPSPSPPEPTPSAASSPTPTATAVSPKTPKPRSGIGPHDTRRLTGSRKVALTFDDGPHPVWTPKVLDLLRRTGVKATFCVVGTEVRAYPALVARMIREGHTLCNHTWHHELDLGTKPEPEIRANLEATNREIRKAVPGAKIAFFRHPGGRWTPAAVKVSRELGMTSLDWDVDPQDWKKPSADAIRTRVINQARPGSIVLLHDGGGDRNGTLAACPAMVEELKRKYGIVLLR